MTFDPSFHPSNPQQPFRTGSDWTLRDYGTPSARSIPPPPPFLNWVPAPEQIAFGEAPRDMSRYTLRANTVTQGAPTPVPPKPVSGLPQQNARPDWSLRDYSANQDRFSIFATPLLPPPIGAQLPQQNARPDWTLRDYSANQDRFSGFFPTSPSIWVPIGEMLAFGELPRDQTALRIPLSQNVLAQSPPSSRPPVLTPLAISVPPLRDLIAERLVIEFPKATYLAIPVVPQTDMLLAFEYEAADLTPSAIAGRTFRIPQNKAPQIPPSAIPYIPPPPWRLDQYQANQDRFSALATPGKPAYPKGLLPTFTLEALIREVPRATLLFQNSILPPPPPFVFGPAAPYQHSIPWTVDRYQALQDQFSALVASLPIPVGFRVMAVTAGYYGGVYRQPGDVFDLVSGLDFSDSTFNYGINSGTTQYGWMLRVAPGTTPFMAETAQPIPLFPIIDPVPPKRFVS